MRFIYKFILDQLRFLPTKAELFELSQFKIYFHINLIGKYKKTSLSEI